MVTNDRRLSLRPVLRIVGIVGRDADFSGVGPVGRGLDFDSDHAGATAAQRVGRNVPGLARIPRIDAKHRRRPLHGRVGQPAGLRLPLFALGTRRTDHVSRATETNSADATARQTIAITSATPRRGW